LCLIDILHELEIDFLIADNALQTQFRRQLFYELAAES